MCKLSASPSHSILTPDQPVPALTLERQTPGRVATEVLKSLNEVSGMTRPGKYPPLDRDKKKKKRESGLFVGWLLNVPTTC